MHYTTEALRHGEIQREEQELVIDFLRDSVVRVGFCPVDFREEFCFGEAISVSTEGALAGGFNTEVRSAKTRQRHDGTD